jgi:hypothetical protein
MTSQTDLFSLHDLFWQTEEMPSHAAAVKWWKRLKATVETVARAWGLPPDEARKEAYRWLVVEYLDATFPRDCEPDRCAHCRGIEDPSDPLIPLGVGPYAWLHRACADPWREKRRETAIKKLAMMKIEEP